MTHIRKALRCFTNWCALRLIDILPTPELDDFQIDPSDLIDDLSYGRD